eukprot:842897-Rhodomonas_salina.4
MGHRLQMPQVLLSYAIAMRSPRMCYAKPGTDLANGASLEQRVVSGKLCYVPTRAVTSQQQSDESALSAYAHATRCPVLTWHMAAGNSVDISLVALVNRSKPLDRTRSLRISYAISTTEVRRTSPGRVSCYALYTRCPVPPETGSRCIPHIRSSLLALHDTCHVTVLYCPRASHTLYNYALSGTQADTVFHTPPSNGSLFFTPAKNKVGYSALPMALRTCYQCPVLTYAAKKGGRPTW